MEAVAVAVLIGLAGGCRRQHSQEPGGAGVVAVARDYEAAARRLYQHEPGYEQRWPVEFHIRVLEGLTQDLERAALDLGENMGAPWFAAEVEFGFPAATGEQPVADGVTEIGYGAPSSTRMTAEQVGAALAKRLAEFRYLEIATIKIKRGALLAPGEFVASQVAIELAGRERGGGWRRDAGTAEMRFARRGGEWEVTRFVVNKLVTQRAPEKLFGDVTEAWLEAVPERVRRMLRGPTVSDGIHQRMLEGKRAPSGTPPISYLADTVHPGAVVADVNGDGFDDLFVWDVEGEAALLVNDRVNGRGRGFVDRTDETGLGLHDVSAAAFADLNGDGQLDAVIGHWAGPAEIRIGEGGRFRPGAVNRYTRFPANVVAIALADVNRDGGLDVYFATAASEFHRHAGAVLEAFGEGPIDPNWIPPFDPSELPLLVQALPLARAFKRDHRLDVGFNRIGPPNVLMQNLGSGRFVDVTAPSGLTLFRDSLSASFADFDDDGWPDLFVGNDFASASFYFNRQGVFEDKSHDTGADRLYYGMGTSVGDFDNDGDLDLLVTQMYSSAGNRILADESSFGVELEASEREARRLSARGNTLLENLGGGRFQDGTERPALAPVRNANWAYSAQLIDADGDGWLDVYAPNGYFSSPQPADEYVRDL